MGLHQAIIKLKILKFKKFSGFSLIELLIALLILTAMAGSILLNFRDFNKVSAEQEADRIMRWLYNIMLRADYSDKKFELTAFQSFSDNIYIKFYGAAEPEYLYASSGCKFKNNNSTSSMIYEPQWGTLTPSLTLQIQDYKNNLYYLIISGQGQIRTSDSPAE